MTCDIVINWAKAQAAVDPFSGIINQELMQKAISCKPDIEAEINAWKIDRWTMAVAFFAVLAAVALALFRFRVLKKNALLAVFLLEMMLWVVKAVAESMICSFEELRVARFVAIGLVVIADFCTYPLHAFAEWRKGDNHPRDTEQSPHPNPGDVSVELADRNDDQEPSGSLRRRREPASTTD